MKFTGVRGLIPRDCSLVLASFLHVLSTRPRPDHNMTTRTERFQRKSAEKTEDPTKDEEEEVIRFSPDEEAVCAFHSYLGQG